MRRIIGKTAQLLNVVRWALVISMIWVTTGGWCHAQDTTEAQKLPPAITKMHGELSKIKFAIIRDKGNEVQAELKREPILRYTDPQREFPDAALWVWTVDGRPAGFSKVERLGTGRTLSWQYCVSAVNDEKLAVRWPDGIAWRSRKAAFQFRTLDDNQDVQKSAPLRLVQLRNLARRFSASTVDRESNREEMRMLAQPIFRYSCPDSAEKLLDGAVFAMASNGTNPDALLLIQARQSEKGAVWEYGCLAMTGDRVSFQLDDKSVFEHEGALSPGDHGHWLWLVLRD
jgi:hypothetical protein